MIKAAVVAAMVVSRLVAPQPAASREQTPHGDFPRSEIRAKVATGHKNSAALEEETT